MLIRYIENTFNAECYFINSKMDSKNTIVKSSIWNLVGGAIPLIVGFLSIPFAIKGLGNEGFGILTIAWIVLGYFGMFDLGFAQATTKYSAQYLAKQDFEKFNSVFWVSLITSFVMGLIGCLILTSTTHLIVEKFLNIPDALKEDAKLTFMILGASLPFIISTTSLRGVISASNRFDILNKIQTPSNVLTYILPCLSYFFTLKLSFIIILIVIMRLAIFLVYIITSFKLHPYLLNYKGFDKIIFKSMLGFGGWISLSNLLSPILVYIDRFLIGSLISISSVSFYTAPYELVIRTRLFPNAIVDAIFPKFSSFEVGKVNSTISDLFLKSLKYITIVMGLVVMIFISFSSEIINIWLGAEYIEISGKILQILAVGIFFNGIATVPFFLLQGIGRPDIPAKIHTIELILFALMFYFMIKYYGLLGAAITWSTRTTFDFILLFVMTYVIDKNFLSGSQFKLILKSFLIILISTTLVFILYYFINILFIKILLVALIFLLVIYLIWNFTIDNEERTIISSKWINIISKNSN